MSPPNLDGLERVGWEGAQSALDPEGPQAAAIGDLWWTLLPILTVVFILVVAALLYALFRRRGAVEPTEEDKLAVDPGSKRRTHRVVATLFGITCVTEIAILVASVSVGASMAHVSGDGEPLTVEVIGHQWWWEVRYPSADPSLIAVTANEIHIPVGTPIRIAMRSDDVIHSFWVPRLHGKRDLIPGKPTETHLRADTIGIYRGQCAEFCGAAHAKMALYVVVQSKEDFASWLNDQRRGGAPPMKPEEKAGQRVFMSSTCPVCHQIAGTDARGGTGPDLSHIASRLSLAAGSLENTRETLASWILDAQRHKPGSYMPPNPLSEADLELLLTYLETLR